MCGPSAAQAQTAPRPFAPAAPQPFAPAGAQAAPLPPFVPLPAPPVPFGPTTRAIGDAYSAIARASVLDPAAAQRAQFAYRMALSRLAMGDRAGAAAFAASAMALASAPTAATAVRPSLPNAGTTAPRANEAATFPGAVSLPNYILAARDRIARARAAGGDVSVATGHLRKAVDAYLDGDPTRSRHEARAATDALP